MATNSSQKLRLSRQRTLANWLRAIGPETDDFQIQMKVFQLTVGASDKTYEFCPTKTGPHSFQLEADLPVVRAYLHNSSVRQPMFFDSQASEVIGKSNGKQLLGKILEHWPFYGINYDSEEIATPKVLAEKHSIEEKRKEASKVFTIGYEGRSLEGFLNLLLRQGVKAIADVRAIAFSYKFGFRSPILKESSEAVGLEYKHFPELGIASHLRSKHTSPEQRSQMFEQYKQSLCDKTEALINLANFIALNKRVALLCFERDVANCHRRHLRDWICRTLGYSALDL